MPSDPVIPKLIIGRGSPVRNFSIRVECRQHNAPYRPQQPRLPITNYMHSTLSAKIKPVYLLVLACGLFFVSDGRILVGLIAVQAGFWLYAGLGLGELLRGTSRLKWFFLLVIISYLLIPPVDTRPDFRIDLGWFEIGVYLSGLEHAALMLGRVFLLVFTSLWVRLSEPTGTFVTALGKLGLPESIAIVIDAGLSLAGSGEKTGGKGRGDGRGGGRGDGQSARQQQNGWRGLRFADIRQARFSFMDDLVGRALLKSRAYLREHYPHMNEAVRRDAAIILAVVVAIMSLKLLQILPGLPFAPGHKNVVVIPLLLMASLATRSRFGGFSAGVAVGIVSFLLGYGKFGAFEILQFALPGLLADLLAPVLVGGSGLGLLVRLAILGALLGLARFAANFMVLMLAGSPELAWLAFTPMLISQVVFGGLSGLVCVYVVKRQSNHGFNEPGQPGTTITKQGDTHA